MSHPGYTEQELAHINERVWSDPPASGQKRTSVPCPACGADTRVLISWSGSGDGCGAGLLIINCDACGRTGRVKPAASPCPDLDETQMREIVESFQHGQHVVCPTCGTPLAVKPGHTLGGLHYSAYCYRGGALGQLSLPR
ncbi:MAG: hypothetical protein SX243_22445 [Acidobacteriota bacterium]|nr:hypothetical protein [Acidobacteriota bacterium]